MKSVYLHRSREWRYSSPPSRCSLKQVPRTWPLSVSELSKGTPGGSSHSGIDTTLAKGSGRDYAEAMRWYRLAAAQGNSRGQFELGHMYANGRGVPQTMPKPRAGIYGPPRATADREGLPRCRSNSGIYTTSAAVFRRTTPKPHAGTGWREISTRRSSVSGACTPTGPRCPTGTTLKLARWWRLAATTFDGLDLDKGVVHPGAVQSRIMYGDGRGVPQDDVSAHMWLNLATAQSTGEQRERIAAARDAVAERMTREDLSEAQQRAREWSPRVNPPASTMPTTPRLPLPAVRRARLR